MGKSLGCEGELGIKLVGFDEFREQSCVAKEKKDAEDLLSALENFLHNLFSLV